MTATLEPSSILSRVLVSIVGAYALIWGLVAFIVAAGVALGTDFHEAETFAHLIAFVAYLAAFLWAFAARCAALVWGLYVGGGALLTLAALGLQQILL